MQTAAIGSAIWLTWAVVVRPEWTAVLLLLSPFVLLPLGLGLASRGDTGPEAPVLQTLASLAPAIAVTAALSFLPDPGPLAALLSAPWLIFTIAVALAGVGRILSRRTLCDPGIGADAGLVFLAVGGAWLTLSRAGLNPLGFSDAIVQLTAVHFHYAGFALPIVAGFTASRLRRSVFVPIAVIIGVPLTAIGITAGGRLEWFAATTMALAGLATAGLLIQFGAQQRGFSRWLIGTAGVALVAGMSLALGWSWSGQFGWEFLGLDSMARIHGSLNALGFGLLGLVGLNTLAATTGDSPTMSLHLGRPSTGTLRNLATLAAGEDTTSPVGLLNMAIPAGYQSKSWRRDVEHDDLATASAALNEWLGYRAAGIALWPSPPPLEVGQTLALAIPVGPISASATCRIVEVIDEPGQYGFTYSTLPHHPEDGEESFILTQNAEGHIDFTVTAVWRPSSLATRICPPFTRFLQNRVINRYLDGIATFQQPDVQKASAR